MLSYSRLLMLLMPVVMVGCQSDATEIEENETSPTVTLQDNKLLVPTATQAYLKTQTVHSDAVVSVAKAPARIEFRPDATVSVRSPVNGRIIEVYQDIGAKVNSGDALLQIDSLEASAWRTESQQAKAAFQAAQAEYQRQLEMGKRNISTQRERLAAETALATARAELARAEQVTGYLGEGQGRLSTLVSPLTGVVLERHASTGAMTDGDVLLTVGDPAALWAIAHVFERDIDAIRIGAQVDIELSNRQQVTGTVTRIGSVVDSRRRAPIYIELDNTDKVKAGMTARALIQSSSSKAFSVPASAVLIEEQQRYLVFIHEAEGRYQQRDVTIGSVVDGQVEVLSGLEDGDQVVIKGGLLLARTASQLL